MQTSRFFALLLIVAAFATPALAAGFQPFQAKSFNAALSSGKPVIVHVHAEWCIYCRRQIPILDQLVGGPDLKGVTAFRANYDTDREFLKRYRVNQQATVLVFKGGKETARSSFVTDRGELTSTIRGGL